MGEANNNAAKSKSRRVYIGYMGALRTQDGAPRSDHAELLGLLMRRKKNPVLHIYNNSFSGFAARLSEKEAKSIALRDGVVSVFPDRVLKLDTTRSWDFLKSQHNAGVKFDLTPTSSPSISNKPSSRAYNAIIGIIDSGIWPESSSFNDTSMGPIPSSWKGICMEDKKYNSSTCNRKVIGARSYDNPDEPGYIVTARDENGHGTHVSSIAAGRPVPGASYYGVANGTARGGAPDARIAVYRVCGADGGCLQSAILKAFDDAISDGVDVISQSFSSPPEEEDRFDFFNDASAIGAFHAVEAGITVVTSAGNYGPFSETVANVAPWVLTVAATTIDRDFEAKVVLGGNMVIKGGSINFSNLSRSAVYPLINGRSAQSTSIQLDLGFNASNCVPGSLDDAKVNGTIVLCENKDGEYGTRAKFVMLKSQGAIGMIVIDNDRRQVPSRFGTSPIDPIVVVDEEDGARILSYINSTRNPLATILPTVTILNYKPAPVIAYFSSRGPVYDMKNLLKPDVAAPGASILAAWPSIKTRAAIPSKELPLFNIISGTSMSCPHVSGLAATIKSWHPTWSSSAIRSAIMTTAIQRNNLGAPITTNDGTRATPYDIGAGEISTSGPLRPGLVYETETNHYIQFLCNFGYNASVIRTISLTVPDNFSCPSNSSFDLISNLNYPSIAVTGLRANGSKIVKRTVTNVAGEYSTYTATVEKPSGIKVRVVPRQLHFTKDVKKLSFQVIFVPTASFEEDLFGSITWSNKKYRVRSPFVVSNG